MVNSYLARSTVLFRLQYDCNNGSTHLRRVGGSDGEVLTCYDGEVSSRLLNKLIGIKNLTDVEFNDECEDIFNHILSYN